MSGLCAAGNRMILPNEWIIYKIVTVEAAEGTGSI